MPVQMPAANSRLQQPADIRNVKATELTFGVEIECFIPLAAYQASGWTMGAYHSRGGAIAGHRGWRCTADGSLRAPAGHVAAELVSGILRGNAGLQSVLVMLAALRSMNATVNTSCGFHVHVGWPAEASTEAFRRLLQLWANHERGAYAVTGSIRREFGNYSRPIKDALRGVAKFQTLEDVARQVAAQQRYNALNIVNLIGGSRARSFRTVEFRLWSPTLADLKAKLFIQLALAFVGKSLDAKADVSWDSTAKLPATGQGNAEAIRMFYSLGWIKSSQKKGYGLLPTPEAEADRLAMMYEALRLAKLYDGKRQAAIAQGMVLDAVAVNVAEPAFAGEL